MSPDAVNSSRVLCRYFASGCCSLGERCSYSHDRSAPADNVCRYYLKGKYGLGVSAEGCPFGNKCFYKHQLPDGSIDPGEAPHARRKPHLADFIFR
ncbi:hypothetical protein ANCCEY_00780, partial [Ancylostoma ceylanicum]